MTSSGVNGSGDCGCPRSRSVPHGTWNAPLACAFAIKDLTCDPSRRAGPSTHRSNFNPPAQLGGFFSHLGNQYRAALIEMPGANAQHALRPRSSPPSDAPKRKVGAALWVRYPTQAEIFSSYGNRIFPVESSFRCLPKRPSRMANGPDLYPTPRSPGVRACCLRLGDP